MLNGHSLNGAPLNGGANLVRIVVASAIATTKATIEASGRLALRGSGVVQAGSAGSAIADVSQTATFVAAASMSATAYLLVVDSVVFAGTAEFVANDTKNKKAAAAGVARATVEPPITTLQIAASIAPSAEAMASASVNGVMDGWATLSAIASASAESFAVREGRATAVAAGILPPIWTLPGRHTVADLFATTEASVSATGIRSASAQAPVSSSAAATGDRIAGTLVDMPAAATGSVMAAAVRDALANALVQATAETQSTVFVPLTTTLVGRAVAGAFAYRIAGAAAAATVSASILAVGRLNLDVPAPDHRRMCIPRDVRVMVVPARQRVLRATKSDRTMTAVGVTGG